MLWMYGCGREYHDGCVDVTMSGWTSRCLGPWGGDHGMDANSRHTRPHSQSHTLLVAFSSSGQGTAHHDELRS